tara:strand:- start:1397 stop:1909 length:513 start_codon:yes stop_codon:yes gene_type:complete
MKNILSFFLLLICLDRTLHSNDFNQIPLSEFIENNSVKIPNFENEELLTENLIYESTRCSALFAWIGSVSGNLKNEKGRKLEKKSIFNSKSLTSLALQTLLAKTNDPSNLDEVNLEVNNLIEKNFMNYQSDGSIIKGLEGGYIKGYIKEDLEICNIMIEAYKETFKKSKN